MPEYKTGNNGNSSFTLVAPIEADILSVRPPNIKLDGAVSLSISQVAAAFDQGDLPPTEEEPENNGTGEGESESGPSLTEDIEDYIQQNGLSAKIEKVTNRVNQAGLDHIKRLLLSRKPIYAYLLHVALREENVPADDTLGVYGSLLRNIKTAQEYFYESLVINVLKPTGVPIHYQANEKKRAQLVAGLFKNTVSLTPGKPRELIMKLWEEIQTTGDLREYVDKYFTDRAEVNPQTVTDEVKQAMIEYLQRLSVDLNSTGFDNGNFDEYFALAYSYALDVAEGRQDPIDQVRSPGGFIEWDFNVDHFETIEEQGIIAENIRAAGALDYIYVIGEMLGVFRLGDALILRWANGLLDVPQGETAANLYRYFKLRDERSSSEERAMLYKRVLNKGEAQMLSGAVINDEFPALWGQLVNEVVDYIQRVEENDNVSRQPLYQIIRDIQYNLTTHMTGMALMQVTEMYSHLQEAIDLLKDEVIVDHLAGGRRKNMWTVIERLWQEEFSQTPNVSALRTAAVEGNKIFQFIAAFDAGSVSDAQFQAFLDAAEAYILAQAEGPGGFEEDEDEPVMEAVGGDGFRDDFDDWEA